MKKIISVVLLFIFLYNISGYYLVFTEQQSEIKESVQNFLEEDDSGNLLLLNISQEDEKNITWNGNDEFSLNGKMYDVAFTKREGNVLRLYCYCDSKEDHLFASLDSHIKNNIDNPVSRKNSKDTLKNSLSDYLPYSTKKEFSFSVCRLKKEIKNNFSLLNFSPDKPSPPPRFA
ncbi:MAG: hypothetical protein ABI855_20570 [Bacteroidota bacterium]